MLIKTYTYGIKIVERQIEQAMCYNNRYPVTRKNQQTIGYKSLCYKRKVDDLRQLTNKTKMPNQTREEIITYFTCGLYLHHIFIPAMW